MTVRAKTSGSAHEIRDRELDRLRRRDCVDRKEGRKEGKERLLHVEYHRLVRSGYTARRGTPLSSENWKFRGRESAKSTEGRVDADTEEVRRRSFGPEGTGGPVARSWPHHCHSCTRASLCNPLRVITRAPTIRKSPLNFRPISLLSVKPIPGKRYERVVRSMLLRNIIVTKIGYEHRSNHPNREIILSP